MKPTPDQIQMYIRTVKAIADTIKETPEGAPTGIIYAALCGRMSLHAFEGMLNTLKNAGLIRIDGMHVAHWIAPATVHA